MKESLPIGNMNPKNEVLNMESAIRVLSEAAEIETESPDLTSARELLAELELKYRELGELEPYLGQEVTDIRTQIKNEISRLRQILQRH